MLLRLFYNQQTHAESAETSDSHRQISMLPPSGSSRQTAESRSLHVEPVLAMSLRFHVWVLEIY